MLDLVAFGGKADMGWCACSADRTLACC